MGTQMECARRNKAAVLGSNWALAKKSGASQACAVSTDRTPSEVVAQFSGLPLDQTRGLDARWAHLTGTPRQEERQSAGCVLRKITAA